LNSNATAGYRLAVRNLKRTVRNPLILGFVILQPLIWLAMFSQSFTRLTDFAEFSGRGYDSYLNFFVPSIMALTVLNTATQSGLAMITDIDAGVLDKFLISPISRWSILLGRVLADAVTMAFECLIVLVVAYAMGARAQTGVLGAAGLVLIMVTLGVCAAGYSNVIALRTRNTQVTMVGGMLLAMPSLLLSSGFFPLALQPTWVRWVAKVNPVAYAVGSGQDLMNLGAFRGSLLGMAGVLALAGLLTFAGAIRAFQHVTSGSGAASGHRLPLPARLLAKVMARRARLAAPTLPTR
jgi:ABC-2 type transport system permease protein